MRDVVGGVEKEWTQGDDGGDGEEEGDQQVKGPGALAERAEQGFEWGFGREGDQSVAAWGGDVPLKGRVLLGLERNRLGVGECAS